MEQPLNITALNDFIFCPISIYFHTLYDGIDKTVYQETDQINGTKAHETVDSKSFSTKNHMVSYEVYCDKYGLIGKVDCYDPQKKLLTERKKKIKQIYDGYIFQLYAQCFALREMGFEVNKLALHSMDDNKTYPVPLPEESEEYTKKFEELISSVRGFNMDTFVQTNPQKCARCIYAPYCDRSV